MILTRDQAKTIVDKILAASKADAVRVNIFGASSSNLRFARNSVTTSGTANDVSVSVESTFGKKSGSYSCNQFDDKTLSEAVRKSEDLARVAPEDPEYMPPLEPQQYPDVQVQATADGNLLVRQPGAADAPVDVNAIAQFCQRGPKDCNYATDQMLLELGKRPGAVTPP